MKMIFIKGCLLTSILCLQSSFLAAQGADPQEELFELSLEELMDINIYSASKKVEKIFNSPLSSTTITRREIENSGATSIMEALRMVPGMIVREHTNGNYDIHIRGLDNTLRQNTGIGHNSTITLVTIDGRPVYNPNVGGTYWETLPIGLNDVERIEVVRGPSAPLYGPNAAAGVINIITRDITEEGPQLLRGDLQAGNAGTYIGNVALGTTIGNKTKVMVSGNYQTRDRHQTQFFDKTTNQFVPNASAVTPQAAVPGITPVVPFIDLLDDAQLAQERKGINLFFDHTVSEAVYFGFETGYQDSYSLKFFSDNDYTYHTAGKSDSYYINAHLNYHNLRVRGSFTSGFEHANMTSLASDSRIDFNKADFLAEYDFVVSEKLTIRPGINIQYNKI